MLKANPDVPGGLMKRIGNFPMPRQFSGVGPHHARRIYGRFSSSRIQPRLMSTLSVPGQGYHPFNISWFLASPRNRSQHHDRYSWLRRNGLNFSSAQATDISLNISGIPETTHSSPVWDGSNSSCVRIEHFPHCFSTEEKASTRGVNFQE